MHLPQHLCSVALAGCALLIAQGCSDSSSDPLDPALLAQGGSGAPPPPPPGGGAPPPGGGPPPPGGTPPPPGAGNVDETLLAALQRNGIRPVQVVANESDAMVELGRNLFFDKVLSGNRNISCATCHHPTAGTGDALPLSLGEGATGLAASRSQGSGAVIPRNAPPLFHVAARGVNSMFWDSRVRRDPNTGVLTTPEPALNGPTPVRPDMSAQLTSALAAQAMFPVTSAEEMRGQSGENELADAADNLAVWAAIMARLVGTSDGTVGGIAAYRVQFQAAFPTVATFDELTFAHAARAIAAYERATFAHFNAPLDRYMGGDLSALTPQAKQGGLLFTGSARCTACHRGPLLSDFRHHALAVPQLGPGKGGEPDDRGLALQTGDRDDDYRFRTPSLRNVELTGPWMHDGAFTTLGAVLRHYRDPGNSLLNYDANQLPALFRPLVDADATRNQARIAALPPVLRGGLPIDDQQIAQLQAFLEALTDPAARTPAPVPASVPSGLPVAD